MAELYCKVAIGHRPRCLAPRSRSTCRRGRCSTSPARSAIDGRVIKCPSPLNVLKDAYDRGCYCARADEYQHLTALLPMARHAGLRLRGADRVRRLLYGHGLRHGDAPSSRRGPPPRNCSWGPRNIYCCKSLCCMGDISWARVRFSGAGIASAGDARPAQG